MQDSSRKAKNIKKIKNQYARGPDVKIEEKNENFVFD